jgi:pimeloyl-ACP methyl ester carboxylesterase
MDPSHHRIEIGDTELHYVEAGASGTPILLVHGFPETWWAFHKLIPLLAEAHHVVAVDLRGFGDSAVATGEEDSARHAEDLRELIGRLDLGAVHLTGQDISGATTIRLALGHPEAIRSFTGIETGLPGFGVEALADVTHGGAWHVGVMAAPGIPEMLLAGRERSFLADYAFPSMSLVDGAITEADVDEFVRTYSRPGAFAGAAGLYRAMLAEGEEIRALATARRLEVPAMSVGGFSGPFTHDTLAQVTDAEVRDVRIEGIGHYVAQEAPDRLAEELLGFYAEVDE